MISPKLILGIALALIVMVGIATDVLAGSPEDAYKEGSELSNQGKYSEAISFYNKAISLDPTYTAPYACRGVAYNELGQYQKAIDDCNKAISLDPNFDQAFACRGAAYGHLGQYQKAIDDCDKAISLDPSFTWAYENRADIYEKLGKHELAERDRAKNKELGQQLDRNIHETLQHGAVLIVRSKVLFTGIIGSLFGLPVILLGIIFLFLPKIRKLGYIFVSVGAVLLFGGLAIAMNSNLLANILQGFL